MAVAEFVLNGNAHSYGSGSSFGANAGAASGTSSQSAAGLKQQAISAVASTLNLDDELDSSLLTADRQIELLLWLSNLEMRLPPYGDVN